MRRVHYLMAGTGLVSGGAIFLAAAMAATTTPMVRIFAVKPPSGSPDYPPEIVLNADGSKVTISKDLKTPTKIYFRVEISGWGATPLNGYDTYISYNCPSPPCDCLLAYDTSTSCGSTTPCQEGAECVSGKCKPTSIKNDNTFIYYNRKHIAAAGATAYDNAAQPVASFSWNVRSIGTGPNEPTGSNPNLTAGSLVLNYPNSCPSASLSKLAIDDSLSEVILGLSNTRTKPSVKNVELICAE